MTTPDPANHLLTELNRLHVAVGRPTFGTLEMKSRSGGAHGIAASTVGNLLSGKTKPRQRTVDAFVSACRLHRGQPPSSFPNAFDLAYWRDLVEAAQSADDDGPEESSPVAPSNDAPAIRTTSRETVTIGVIPPTADCFQIRDATSRLREVVSRGGTAVLAQSATRKNGVVVSGMGGVGKTQIAAAYAREVRDAGDLDLLLWVSATTRDSVTSAYAQAAESQSLEGAGDTNQATGQFLTWLETTPLRWLIVLDDVSSPTELKGLWPPHSPQGRVVITTRSLESAITSRGALIQIVVYSPDEACSYISSKLADHPHLADDVAALAEDLFRLPLALGQASAYMIDRDLPCSKFRTRFADRQRQLRDLFPEDAPADDYARTVATTWSLSVEAANRLQPYGLAEPLLQLASVMDPNGIPRAVFATRMACGFLEMTRHLPEGVAKAGIDVDSVRDALHVLRRLHLATLENELVRVHGLVSRAIREHLPPAQSSVIAFAAGEALAQSWPDIERDTNLGRVLRANSAAIHHSRFERWTSGAPRVHFIAANSLGESGNPTGAIAHFTELLAIALRFLGADHSDTLSARNNLAHWRAEAGDPTGAAQELEELLPDLLRVLGPNHPNTLATRNNLAYLRGENGDPSGAAQEFEQLLADQRRVLGPDHPNTLTNRNNLAIWRGENGDPSGAAQELEELLPDLLRVLGPDHPNTLTNRNNLATWRGRTGGASGAAQEFEQLLADQRRVLGPDHPDTLITRYNLAMWRGKAGDPTEAAQELEELLPDLLRVLGPEHPYTLSAVGALAYWRTHVPHTSEERNQPAP